MTQSFLDSINAGLHQALANNQQVVLIGEDLLDPYGGAFKASRGLSTVYPSQVITTPISEAGITGIAGGMALRGLRPVVEIMFGDFLSLAMDQILNHLAKFAYMYNGQVSLPVVIRTPMGGRRGYGPTHSQTLEKHFLGIPGLRVIAPFQWKGESQIGSPGQLLSDIIQTTSQPVLFIENKLQYLLPLLDDNNLIDQDCQDISPSYQLEIPFYRIKMLGAPDPTVTIATYGYMSHLAIQAQKELAFEHEIFSELLVPTQLAPFKLAPIMQSVKSTRHLLTVEEGAGSLGWGAEVLAQVASNLGGNFISAARLTGADHPIPASRQLEEASLPSVKDIVSAVQKMV